MTNDHLGSPRINTDQNGSVTARHDYHPFGEEIIGTGGRTQGLGYTSDDVRKQFTGYERDTETDLDYAQARMYGNSHGRFTSPDPLFMEGRRLLDPQLINLYQYVRNNPLYLVDPTGLSVEVTGDEKDAYLTRLQKNLSFKVQINSKSNLVEITDDKGNVLDKTALKALGKTLKGGEKELFEAITDNDNKATINTVTKDANVDFGRFGGKGTNTIDRSDLEALDNCTGCRITSSQVVGHETLEAYKAARLGATTQGDSHDYANKFFPGLGLPIGQPQIFGDTQRHLVTGSKSVFPVHNSDAQIEITREYANPFPYKETKKGIVPQPPTPGPQPGHILQVRKVK